MLALPGSPYLYQGEELGLEQVDVPDGVPPGPVLVPRTGEHGRDGCRVPIPWSGDAAAVRLRSRRGPAVAPPARRLGATLTVEAQSADPASTLSFYRAALAARRGVVDAGDSVEMLDLGADVLAFRRGDLTVVLNCGGTAVPLPAGEVLVSSRPRRRRAARRHGGLAHTLTGHLRHSQRADRALAALSAR